MLPDKDPNEPEMTNNDPNGFIEYVDSLDSDSLSEMLALRVIPSFRYSIKRHGLTEFSALALRLWTVDMLLDGLKGSTVKRYTGALHTLYREWRVRIGNDDGDSVFSLSLSGLDTEASAKILKETDGNLEAVERFTRISVKQDSPAFVYNKAFQYLLFDPLASLKDIVAMKFSDRRP